MAAQVDHSLPRVRLIRVLDQVAKERGYARKLRSDNGPEFIACVLEIWVAEHDVELTPIEPGKPTQNGYVELFNRAFQKEFLNVYALGDLEQVRDESTR